MKSYKQLLLSAVCATFFLSAMNVFAEEEQKDNDFLSSISSGENVVLFKVHDVKPLRNEDGIVTECEFGLTLYNRSPKNISNATMQLSWLDDGVSMVIDDEDKQDIEDIAADAKKKNFINNRQLKLPRPKTEDFVSKDLMATVVLPQIKPFRQVSLKSKIKSDRCFLMIGDANFSFSSCSITESDSGSGSGVRRSGGLMQEGGSCQTLFRFVSPRDPEYYREFQKVSFNEEAEKRSELRKKEINELEENYNRMIDSLDNTLDVLMSIQ